MNVTEILGYLAASLTTASFLPQVIHTWKSGDTRSISLGMYTLFVVGISAWLVYGLMLGEMPIIIANALTLVLSSLILAMKVRDVLRERRG